jgi:hypothetical protein
MCHVRLKATTILMSCCVFFSLSAVGAEAQPAPPPATPPTGAECIAQAYKVEPGISVRVTIDYHLAKNCPAKRLTERVDDSMAVLVTLKRFNFVNYAVKYTVQDTVIESYVTLEKLWAQIFGLGALVRGATEAASAKVIASACKTAPQAGDFIPCVTDWMWALINEDLAVETAVAANAGKISLDDEAIKTVKETIEIRTTSREEITKKRLRALGSTPTTPQEVQWFQEVQAHHEKVMNGSMAYSSLASLTVNGQLKVLPKNKPGHIITLTLAPRRAENTDADAAAPLVVEYVVQSKFPLVFHVGYGYSRLKDVEFEKVRSLNDQDLFAVVKSNSNTAGMVAYLSYGLVEWKVRGTEQGLLLSLATDFKDPGDRLLVGGSVRIWKKLFFTAGAMSGSVKEGVNPIVETIGDQLGARELFGAVSTRRDWQPHFGISFSVF